MTGTTDPLLQSTIDALVQPGLLIGHRLISPGDELALLEEEHPSIASKLLEVRRASGAARIVARQLLAKHALAECPLPKERSGAPVWPAGVIGSMAHDARVAVATVGMSCDVGAVGIDVEPAEDLPPELLTLVATPRERSRIGDDPYRGRLLFAAKEAVYKAVYPLDRMVLDHHDIEVDLVGGKAVLRNGRVVELRFGISTHLIALAILPAVCAEIRPRSGWLTPAHSRASGDAVLRVETP
jgi:4'-phosphopantetheinyl transferase EntD